MEAAKPIKSKILQAGPSPHARFWSEMQALTPLDPASLAQASLDISLLIPARGAAHSLEDTVKQAHAFLTQNSLKGLASAKSFEIILVPNPSPYPKPGAEPDRSIEISHALARRFEHVRVVEHSLPQGKGAALRTGFAASRGRFIFFTDADLPYRLDFFDQALISLQSGFEFVTGNRRLDTSVFDVPVEFLNLAYRRHRLGMAFNWFVRRLMPIPTTDTQAGIKAMSRELASRAFSRQICPGFFFDLEIFLTAQGHELRHTELPVTLFLNTEKSTVRVLRESWLAAFWLTRISLRNTLKKAYGKANSKNMLLPRRYKSASLGTRAFLEARWRLTPYMTMAAKLPPQGRILDLGCGHGLFALALALSEPGRQIVGLDHDVKRLELAREAAQGVSNVRFTQGTLSDSADPGVHPNTEARRAPTSEKAQGISIIDVMHYLPPEEQVKLLTEAYELLAPGGTLIVREVDPVDGLMSAFNRFYEKMATTIGFTQSEKKQQLFFRNREQWEECLGSVGFEVTSEPCSHPLFADILYVARKPTLEGHS